MRTINDHESKSIDHNRLRKEYKSLESVCVHMFHPPTHFTGKLHGDPDYMHEQRYLIVHVLFTRDL